MHGQRRSQLREAPEIALEILCRKALGELHTLSWQSKRERVWCATVCGPGEDASSPSLLEWQADPTIATGVGRGEDLIGEAPEILVGHQEVLCCPTEIVVVHPRYGRSKLQVIWMLSRKHGLFREDHFRGSGEHGTDGKVARIDKQEVE